MSNIVHILFNQEILENNFIGITFRLTSDPNSYFEHTEFFQFSPRYNSGEVNVWDPNGPIQPSPYTANVGEYTAERFRIYFNLDFGGNGFLTVERVNSTVIITIPRTYMFLGVLSGGLEQNGDISVFYLTGDGSFLISNSEYSTLVGNECTSVNFLLEATENIKKIFVNNLQLYADWQNNAANNGEPKKYTTTLGRGFPYYFKFTNSNDEDVRFPASGQIGVYKLSEENIRVSIISSTNGATVNFSYSYQTISGFIDPVLEWSLNGIDYVSNNIFTGQEDGDYTVYMKDQFGCIKQLDYNINLGSFLRQPNHFISEANSINYILQEVIDECTVFRNQDNSFNKDSLHNMSYCEEILFNTCDVVKTQVKTNYSDMNVTLRREDGFSVEILSVTQSNNLNRFLSLDGVIYNYENGLSGLYFDSGNTYNNIGGIIGTHSLNGNKPEFAKTEYLINVQGFGDFIIQDVLYDENVRKNVIIIQNNFVSLPQQVIVSSTFNILDFEINEFSVDFNSYGEGLYDIIISLTDSDFEDVTYISENINIKQFHENTLYIDYYNNNNRDIFYKYGIKHIIRIPFLDIDYDVKDSVEINVGDFNSELVSSNITKKDIYYFDALPDLLRNKLIIALSCENLFINKIGYIKETSVEIEHVKNTNLGYITQSLVKSNFNYNINNQNIVPLDGEVIYDIPAFINTGSKFLKK